MNPSPVINKGTRRVLAVASGGGHWQQLMLIRDAFADMDGYYATTKADLARSAPSGRCFVVKDCNRDDLWGSLLSLIGVFRVLFRIRPHLVISTGAAPGLIAIVGGRLMGAHTIWIDSVANSERLSMSGTLAGRIANLQLTQSEPVAQQSGARYFGSVL